jgi:hypothetical protein
MKLQASANASKFADDPQKRVAYYQRRQKASGAQIYRPEAVAMSHIQVYDALSERAHAEIAAGQCVTLASYLAARKRKTKRAKKRLPTA